MSSSSRIRQLANESLIYSFLGLITKPSAIAAVLLPLFTRILSPAEFGVFSIIVAISSFLNILVVAGLDNSAARWFYDSSDPEDRKTTISSWFWCQLVISFVICGMLLLFSGMLSLRLFKTSAYTGVIRLMALAIPFATFNKVCGNWLLYQRQAWKRSFFAIAASLITIGLIVAMSLVLRSLSAVFLAQLLAGILVAGLAIILLKSWVATRYFTRTRLKEMLIFSWPLIPAGIAASIVLYFDRFIIKMFQDSSQVGFYMVAMTLASSVALFTGGFQMAWGPFALSIHKEDVAQKVYSKVLSLYIWLGSLLCTALTLFSPWLIKFFSTPLYISAVPCVPFLAFAFLLLGARDIACIGPTIAKKSMPIAKSIFLAAGINIVLNLVLIPRWGKEGAAIASMLAYLGGTVYLFCIAQRIFHIAYRFLPEIICLLFSGLLIIINRPILYSLTPSAVMIKLLFCALFIPLGVILNIVRPGHVKELFRKNAVTSS